MVKRLLVCFILFWSQTSLATGYETEPKCLRLTDREMRQLGMGTTGQPAQDVVKRESPDFPGFDFRRDLQPNAQIVALTQFFSTQHQILVMNPSSVFGGIELKKLVLNESCDVESLEIVIGGTGIYINNDVCAGLEKGEVAQKLAPASAWAQSPFLIDLVTRQCSLYKGDWALTNEK